MQVNRRAITEPSASDAIVERRVRDVAMLVYRRDARIEYGELLGRPVARVVAGDGTQRRELGTLSIPLARAAEALLHRFDPESYPPPHAAGPSGTPPTAP